MSTNQNNILLDYYIIDMCALISQHNVKLGHKPSFNIKQLLKIIFRISTKMHET
jgi:hypothetical protein